ncbi:hypothetical protein ACF0H5_004414 [Mactra antiquata]
MLYKAARNSCIHLAFVVIVIIDFWGSSDCLNMWTSIEERQASSQSTKGCVSPCKIFHIMCKNDGKCRQRGADCTWYCECPSNCEGIFCEKIIDESESQEQNPLYNVHHEQPKQKDVTAFDRNTLAKALLGISKKQTPEEEKKAEQQGDPLIQTLNGEKTICPPDEIAKPSTTTASQTSSTTAAMDATKYNVKSDALNDSKSTLSASSTVQPIVSSSFTPTLKDSTAKNVFPLDTTTKVLPTDRNVNVTVPLTNASVDSSLSSKITVKEITPKEKSLEELIAEAIEVIAITTETPQVIHEVTTTEASSQTSGQPQDISTSSSDSHTTTANGDTIQPIVSSTTQQDIVNKKQPIKNTSISPQVSSTILSRWSTKKESTKESDVATPLSTNKEQTSTSISAITKSITDTEASTTVTEEPILSSEQTVTADHQEYNTSFSTAATTTTVTGDDVQISSLVKNTSISSVSTSPMPQRNTASTTEIPSKTIKTALTRKSKSPVQATTKIATKSTTTSATEATNQNNTTTFLPTTNLSEHKETTLPQESFTTVNDPTQTSTISAPEVPNSSTTTTQESFTKQATSKISTKAKPKSLTSGSTTAETQTLAKTTGKKQTSAKTTTESHTSAMPTTKTQTSAMPTAKTQTLATTTTKLHASSTTKANSTAGRVNTSTDESSKLTKTSSATHIVSKTASETTVVPAQTNSIDDSKINTQYGKLPSVFTADHPTEETATKIPVELSDETEALAENKPDKSKLNDLYSVNNSKNTKREKQPSIDDKPRVSMDSNASPSVSLEQLNMTIMSTVSHDVPINTTPATLKLSEDTNSKITNEVTASQFVSESTVSPTETTSISEPAMKDIRSSNFPSVITNSSMDKNISHHSYELNDPSISSSTEARPTEENVTVPTVITSRKAMTSTVPPILKSESSSTNPDSDKSNAIENNKLKDNSTHASTIAESSTQGDEITSIVTVTTSTESVTSGSPLTSSTSSGESTEFSQTTTDNSIKTTTVQLDMDYKSVTPYIDMFNLDVPGSVKSDILGFKKGTEVHDDVINDKILDISNKLKSKHAISNTLSETGSDLKLNLLNMKLHKNSLQNDLKN